MMDVVIVAVLYIDIDITAMIGDDVPTFIVQLFTLEVVTMLHF